MPTVVPAWFWNVRYWPVGIWTESNLQPKVSSRNFLVSLRFVLASSVNAIAPGVLDLLESFPLFIGPDMLTPRGEDAAYVLLAFLRYGLKYHALSLEATRRKPLPSFQDLVKEYCGRRSQN